MDNEVGEKIKVWAFFDNTSIFPIAISWRRRLIKLEKVIFVGNRRVGQVFVKHLVCSGEGANYELLYNPLTSNWQLVKVVPV